MAKQIKPGPKPLTWNKHLRPDGRRVFWHRHRQFVRNLLGRKGREDV